MSQKILVFGDIGIDDTMALIYSHFDEAIDVVGVVADYGNVTRDKAYANVNYIRHIFDIDPAVKVIMGADMPMTGETPHSFTEVHGEYGLGPIKPPQSNEQAVEENFFEVVEIIRQYEDQELIIVSIGRLTSLATMFIFYPSVMKSVHQIYIMGGAFWVPGNITAVAEANIYGDPIAAKIVLKEAFDVTIVPLNVTRRALVTPQMVDVIGQTDPTDIIKPMLDFYYDFYKQRTPWITGTPMHDVLTVMAPVYRDMLVYRKLPVGIVQNEQGIDRGQTITDIRPYAEVAEEEAENEKHHRIAVSMSYWQFYQQFMTMMTRLNHN